MQFLETKESFYMRKEVNPHNRHNDLIDNLTSQRGHGYSETEVPFCGNRLINSHSLLVTESNKTLGRTEELGTALPALLVKKERVTKPLRKPAWKATSLPDFVQSSLAVIHSYQLCLRSNREQVWLSTVLQ